MISRRESTVLMETCAVNVVLKSLIADNARNF